MGLGLTQKHQGGVPRPLGRREEPHPCLLGGPLAFALIAGHAGGDHVLPVGLASAGTGHHMIYGQLTLCRLSATILAGVVVSGQYRPPRQGQKQTARDPHKVDQPDDQRKIEGEPLGADLSLGSLDYLGFLLEKEDDSPSQGDNVERFKGSIKHQDMPH